MFRSPVMEQKEAPCLNPLLAFPVAPEEYADPVEECIPPDAVRVVITTENYQIEIDIY